MNYPYKKFLATANTERQRSIARAEKVVSSVGMTMSVDEGFPWTDGFRNAVGRCSLYTDGEDFMISIHLRAIYAGIREILSGRTFPADNGHVWEKEISEAVDETVFHEIGHGIYGTACEYYDWNDDFREWCASNGFDRQLFEYEDEEELCEDYCREREYSALGRFIKAYASWNQEGGEAQS